MQTVSLTGWSLLSLHYTLWLRFSVFIWLLYHLGFWDGVLCLSKQGHVLQIGSLQYSREEKCHNLRKALSVSVSPPTAIWSFFRRMNEHGPLDHLCAVCRWWIIIKLMYASQKENFNYAKLRSPCVLSCLHIYWLQQRHPVYLVLFEKSKNNLTLDCLWIMFCIAVGHWFWGPETITVDSQKDRFIMFCKVY